MDQVLPQPPITPTPPISPDFPPSNPKNHVIAWIVAGAVILTIGIGIGLVAEKYLSPPQISSYKECVKANGNQIQTIYPGTCVTDDGRSFREVLTDEEKKKLQPPDETTSWKTYTTDFWGITFKYPDFDATCCGISGAVTGNPVTLITLADSTTVVPNTDAPFDGIALYGIPNNGNLTLDQYVEKEKAIFLADFKSMADPGQVNQGKTTKTTVAGQPALVLTNYSWDGITRTYFKSNANSFIFEISKKEKSPNHFVSYDQILSTFKFLEQTTLVPADLQTQVSGVRCAPVSTEPIVTITIPMDNVPQPRCKQVTANQKLQVVNNSQRSIKINVGKNQTDVSPAQSYQFPEALGDFLAPGGHSIFGAEIWLK